MNQYPLTCTSYSAESAPSFSDGSAYSKNLNLEGTSYDRVRVYNEGLWAIEDTLDKIKNLFEESDLKSKDLNNSAKLSNQNWVKLQPQVKKSIYYLVVELLEIQKNMGRCNALTKLIGWSETLKKECQKEMSVQDFGEKLQTFKNHLPGRGIIKTPIHHEIKFGNKLLLPYPTPKLYLVDKDITGDFAIDTSSFVYREKPEETSEYLPYTEDGKDWILLNRKSLGEILDIHDKDIYEEEKSSMGGNPLKTLVDKRVRSCNVLTELSFWSETLKKECQEEMNVQKSD